MKISMNLAQSIGFSFQFCPPIYSLSKINVEGKIIAREKMAFEELFVIELN